MATVQFLYRVSKPKANLRLRLRHHITYADGSRKNFQPEIYINVEVSKEDFDAKSFDKQTTRILEDIEDYIIDAFNKKKEKYFEPTSQWLQQAYDSFGNKNIHEDAHLLTEWIERFKIDLINKGRSANRIKAFPGYINKIKEFDASIEMHELSINNLEKIYSYLINDLEHATSSAQRLMKDIVLVGKFAMQRGAQLGENFLLYKVPTDTKAQRAKKLKPIVLTEEEVDAIYNLKLTQPYLINTRKWILLATYTAQRGDDVMKKIKKENFKLINGKLHIELTQDKVGNHMVIPALKRVEEIYNADDMPTSISLVNFNKYSKEVCEKAGIVDEITHKKSISVTINGKETTRVRVVKLSKFKYIASHLFRRTFCTMYYEKGMEVREIMKISGHKTEREFLKYIGEVETNFDKWENE